MGVGAMGIMTRGGDSATGGRAGIGDLGKAFDYMRSHGDPDARLVNGTAPFAGATIAEPEPSPKPEPRRRTTRVAGSREPCAVRAAARGRPRPRLNRS